MQQDSVLTYTLTVSNRSGTDANNVTVVQNLPPTVIFGSASGIGWTCGQAGGVVSCDRATLAASSSAPPISVIVTTLAIEGPINTTATVSGDETDPVAFNDRAAEATTVLADVGTLHNDLPPVVTAFSCVLGRFELPGFPSLGSELVLEPLGGAAAVFAPSGLSAHGQAARLNEALVRAVFERGSSTLGDAVLEALQELAAGSAPFDLHHLYVLLGDPALRLW